MNNFKIGNLYTVYEIQGDLGGEIQSYLPQKNGVIVCGRFKIDKNPDAPLTDPCV